MKKSSQQPNKNQRPMWTASSNQNQKLRIQSDDGTSDIVTPRPSGTNLGTILKPKSLNFSRPCCELKKSSLSIVTPGLVKTRDKLQTPSRLPKPVNVATQKAKISTNKENFVKYDQNFTVEEKADRSANVLRENFNNVVCESASRKEADTFEQAHILNSELCHSHANIPLDEKMIRPEEFGKQKDLIKDQLDSQKILDLIEINSKLEKENVELKSKYEEKDFLLEEYRKTFAIFRVQFIELESEIWKYSGNEDELSPMKKIQLRKVRKLKGLHDQIPNKLEWRTPKSNSSDSES